MRTQQNSSLGFFCLYAGNPLPPKANNGEIKAHAEALFEAAGEEGIQMWAWVQWLIQFKKLDKNGQDVIGKDGYAEYVEIKTQESCRRFAERNARVRIRETGVPAGFENANAYIAFAVENAYKFIDPVSYDERRVSLEIDRVLPPA